MILQLILLALSVRATDVARFYSALSACPLPCAVSGYDPSNWTHYHSTEELFHCDQTTLFDLNIHCPIGATGAGTVIRACASGSAITSEGQSNERLFGRQKLSFNDHKEGSSATTKLTACGQTSQHKIEVRFLRSEATADPALTDQVLHASAHMSQYLRGNQHCGETIVFARSGKVVLGSYVGSAFPHAEAAGLMDKFSDHVKLVPGAKEYGFEVCRSFGPETFGVLADTSGDLDVVQRRLASWSNATCPESLTASPKISNVTVSLIHLEDITVSPNGDGIIHSLERRDVCKYTQVKAGDGCWALADRCNISQDDLKKFNGDKADYCNTLKVDQYVCCSAGSLPDFSPQPKSDGGCFDYQVRAGDSCYDIAVAHSINNTRIESVNQNTWGWQGCLHLQVGQVICLSTGRPPMPAIVPNAICGPQVPGTKNPGNEIDIAKLNPCQLNACCNIWGQCGITPAFCIPSSADTKAPGTAAPGSNGCISNCGTDITNNATKPATFRAVGYFEAFNKDRPCLHMRAADMDQYSPNLTDVHYAFANITADFQVQIGTNYESVFEEFTKLQRLRRVLSFGGWSFSTAVDTFPIFRQAVTDAQRQAFASSAVEFLKKHNLDGLDFDWEYPGAPDIPNIPAGDPLDGERYLSFLKQVRQLLPASKTLSIAAPASYWYLRGFPIDEIAEIVDYIVYMTYDLHGQWDYSNKFVNEGCLLGNCLRSHVNQTETNYALAMITKAGVPAHKILLGLPRYGRSFKMSEAGCTTEDCNFEGPNSTAMAGLCTGTPGYLSNFEIRDIISQAAYPDDYGTVVNKAWSTYEGDFLVFNDNNWVSYLKDETYRARSLWAFNSNLGGIVEWATDLDADWDDEKPNQGDWGDETDQDMCDWSLNFSTLDDLEATADKYDPYCKSIYAMETLSTELQAALTEYDAINDDYDDLFGYYTKYIKGMIPGTLRKFMSEDGGPGNKYFDCTMNDFIRNVSTRTCPFDLYSLGGHYLLYFELKHDMKDAFYGDLLKNYGIEESWVKFGTDDLSDKCRPSLACQPGRRIWYGVPMMADDIQVPNPRSIVNGSQINIDQLQLDIAATYFDLLWLQWDGQVYEPAQVYAYPVAMIRQAVSSMKKVKEIGETEKEAEQKNLIITILFAVLTIVPFIGEAAAAAAGLANVARVLTLIGEAANAATALYDVIDNPESGFMNLFASLLGAAAFTRNGESISKISKVRRELADAGVPAKLGKILEADTKKIKNIVQEC